MKTTQAEIKLGVEEQLRRRLETHGIKPKSAKGLKMQAEFLVGAMAALQIVFGDDEEKLAGVIPPAWPIFIMSGRSILED